jgi:dienelactone hydrolase
MRACVSQPETTDKVPGILVIMEIFGVNKPIQEVTDRLSREDDVAVAPVLYHRLGANRLQPIMQPEKMPGRAHSAGSRSIDRARLCGNLESYMAPEVAGVAVRVASMACPVESTADLPWRVQRNRAIGIYGGPSHGIS